MTEITYDGWIIRTKAQDSDPAGYLRHAFGHTKEDAVGMYNDNPRSMGYVGVSSATQDGYAAPFVITESDGVLSIDIGESVTVVPEEPEDDEDDEEYGGRAEVTF